MHLFDLLEERFHRRIALFLVLVQRLQNHSFERGRALREKLPYRRRLILQNAHQQRSMVFTGERPLIGKQFVENHSQRPNVATRVGLLAADSFRRHVGQRAAERSGLRFRSIRQARDAEIDHLDDCVARHDDVGGLDVAVNHAVTMSMIQGTAGLHHIPHPGGQRQGRLAGDHLLQALTLQIFHDNKGSAVRFSQLVNGNDVGVLQAARRAGLTVKALEQIAVFRNSGSDRFDGHSPPDKRIAAFEHHTHGSAADFLEDFVSANPLYDGFRHRHHPSTRELAKMPARFGDP
jgi:hypothetical protein